jgi:hypothetical protein
MKHKNQLKSGSDADPNSIEAAKAMASLRGDSHRDPSQEVPKDTTDPQEPVKVSLNNTTPPTEPSNHPSQEPLNDTTTDPQQPVKESLDDHTPPTKPSNQPAISEEPLNDITDPNDPVKESLNNTTPPTEPSNQPPAKKPNESQKKRPR